MVDCYSWRQGNSKSIDLRHLTDASIALTEVLEHSEKDSAADCLVLDSFTDFLLTNEPDAAVKFSGPTEKQTTSKKIHFAYPSGGGPARPEDNFYNRIRDRWDNPNEIR